MTPINKIRLPDCNRTQWGQWKLDTSIWVLAHASHSYYEIDLEKITRSSEMLDVIMQLSGKTWVTAEDLADLIYALRDIYHPQANLCSWGHDRIINATQYLKEKYQCEKPKSHQP